MGANGKTVTFTVTTGVGANFSGTISAATGLNTTSASNAVKGFTAYTVFCQFLTGSVTITSGTTLTVDVDSDVWGTFAPGETIKFKIAAGQITDTNGNTNSSVASGSVTNNSTTPFTLYWDETNGQIFGGRGRGAKACGRSDATPGLDGEAEAALRAAFNAVKPTGGTLYVQGSMWGTYMALDTISGFTIRGDPLGAVLYTATETLPDRTTLSVPVYGMIRAESRVAAASWTQLLATSTYSIQLDTEPTAVVENFDPTASTPKGVLVKAASVNGVTGLAAAGTWFWDSTGGPGVSRLYVRGSSSQAMTGQADGYWRYCVDGGTSGGVSGGLFMSNACTNCTIGPGLGFSMWCGDTASASIEKAYCAGFFTAGAKSGNLITGCHGTGGGAHIFGFVGETADNNVIRNCIGDNLRAGSDGGNGFVIYTLSGAITNGLIDSCVMRKRPLLRVDGTPLTQTTTGGRVRATYAVGGFFTHSDPAASVASCVIRNCGAVNYNVDIAANATYDCYGTSFGNGAGVLGPTNANDASTYPCRYIGCSSINQVGIENDVAASASFVRCIWTGASPDATKGVAASSFVSHAPSEAVQKMLYESCVMCADTSPSYSLQEAVYRFGAVAGDAIFKNCTVRQNGSTNVQDCIVWLSLPATSTISCYGCEFSSAHGTGVFATEDGAGHFSPSNFIAVGCAYDGIGATGNRWLTNSDLSNNSYDTKAEYVASIDATGVYLWTPGFTNTTNGTINLEGKVGSAIRTTTKMQSIHAATGVNGKQYGGQYGAYQYGGGRRSGPGGGGRFGSARSWRVR